MPGYIPGGLAQSCALQTRDYTRFHGFGAVFEAGRLSDIGAFLARYDAARDGIWLLVDGGRVQGSIVIDGGVPQRSAQLRWFIVSDELRGGGWGQRLMATAMEFCRTRFPHVYLHTFAGSMPRASVRAAWLFVDQTSDRRPWGPTVLEQRFEWTFKCWV